MLSECYIESEDIEKASEHINKALYSAPNASFQARCIGIINALEEERKKTPAITSLNDNPDTTSPNDGENEEENKKKELEKQKRIEALKKELEEAKITYKSARAAWLREKDDVKRRRMKRWERKVEELENKISAEN
jgi:hypothetical protein